eukprot:scaffold58487_cov20-Cyclotella_meneghiniana.AAC.1
MASVEGGVIGMGDMTDALWKGKVKACRPENGDDENEQLSSDDTATESTHTIRAVTVPSVVDHRYVQMSKDAITNAHE